MVTVGVVFEQEGHDFSGKAHQLYFVTVPLQGELFSIDHMAIENDDDLYSDVELASTDWFRVERRSQIAGAAPSVDIFVSPVDIAKELVDDE